MGYNDDSVDISYVEIIHETTEAYLFDIYGDGTDGVWIPLSEMENLDQSNKTFEIPQWLSEKKGLE